MRLPSGLTSGSGKIYGGTLVSSWLMSISCADTDICTLAKNKTKQNEYAINPYLYRMRICLMNFLIDHLKIRKIFPSAFFGACPDENREASKGEKTHL